MTITLKEAAGLVKKSPRHLRKLLETGKLQGSKHNGIWRVRREDLAEAFPDYQAELKAKLDEVRGQVDATLDKIGHSNKVYPNQSLGNLKVWQRLRPVFKLLREVESQAGEERPQLNQAIQWIHQAALSLATGYHEYHDVAKASAYRESRNWLSLAVGQLLLQQDDPRQANSDIGVVIELLEQDVLSALGGLIKRMEKKR